MASRDLNLPKNPAQWRNSAKAEFLKSLSTLGFCHRRQIWARRTPSDKRSKAPDVTPIPIDSSPSPEPPVATPTPLRLSNRIEDDPKSENFEKLYRKSEKKQKGNFLVKSLISVLTIAQLESTGLRARIRQYLDLLKDRPDLVAQTRSWVALPDPTPTPEYE
ncbi:hypothetical protein N7453_000660 [Penicillium expansum]|nr:hypothetical protein N7453_000660 [Penicillium expansum]